MNTNRKWIALGLVLLGVIAYWVFGHMLVGIWSLAKLREVPIAGPVDLPTLLGALIALAGVAYLYRSKRFNEWAGEVTVELKKVTWPTMKETRASTVVVIVVTFIMSLFLGLFDFIWSGVTDLIYGG